VEIGDSGDRANVFSAVRKAISRGIARNSNRKRKTVSQTLSQLAELARTLNKSRLRRALSAQSAGDMVIQPKDAGTGKDNRLDRIFPNHNSNNSSNSNSHRSGA